MRVICAWCRQTIESDVVVEGSQLSHGICLRCFPDVAGAPVHDLRSLAADELDALPFGAVRLRGDGTVLEYNRFESELADRDPDAVVGRRFFSDVAPCTNVRELAGWLASARATARTQETRLQFVFAFATGRVLVDLSLSYHADSDTAHLLVRPVRREDDPAPERARG